MDRIAFSLPGRLQHRKSPISLSFRLTLHCKVTHKKYQAARRKFVRLQAPVHPSRLRRILTTAQRRKILQVRAVLNA